MDLLNQFQEHVKEHRFFFEKDMLLIAASGGADSTILCALCHLSGFKFSMAHCNFQLRGEESERDEAFVKGLAIKYNVPFFTKRFETAAEAENAKTGIEETARNLRYQWFRELIEERQNSGDPLKYILTAHHADDNIESVMMNFFRGTGVKGMRGILPKQGNIIRPLLLAGRKDILEYAAQNKIEFVEDSSNASNDYTRNFFRNELLPSVEKIFPAARQNILKNAERFKDVEKIYNNSIASAKAKLIEQRGAEIHIPVLKLAKAGSLPTVIYEIIKEYGFTSAQVPEAGKLLQAASGKYIVSGTYRILRNRNWLIISPLTVAGDVANIIIEKGEENISFPGGEIKLSYHDRSITIDPDLAVACIDGDKLEYPLLLRKKKTGDYFYPLGMSKKKKLSRFFTDIKLSLLQKEDAWVLESGKKIIWAVGYRIDNRFKVNPQTNNIVKMIVIVRDRKGLDASDLP